MPLANNGGWLLMRFSARRKEKKRRKKHFRFLLKLKPFNSNALSILEDNKVNSFASDMCLNV